MIRYLRTFSVELGNNEGLRDMGRNYETRIILKGLKSPEDFKCENDETEHLDTTDTESILSDFGGHSLEILGIRAYHFEPSYIYALIKMSNL